MIYFQYIILLGHLKYLEYITKWNKDYIIGNDIISLKKDHRFNISVNVISLCHRFIARPSGSFV